MITRRGTFFFSFVSLDNLCVLSNLLSFFSCLNLVMDLYDVWRCSFSLICHLAFNWRRIFSASAKMILLRTQSSTFFTGDNNYWHFVVLRCTPINFRLLLDCNWKSFKPVSNVPLGYLRPAHSFRVLYQTLKSRVTVVASDPGGRKIFQEQAKKQQNYSCQGKWDSCLRSLSRSVQQTIHGFPSESASQEHPKRMFMREPDKA